MDQENSSTDSAADLREKVDLVVYRAGVVACDDLGAPIEMLIDRMLTYAAAQAASMHGSARTATIFRGLAERIESGVFDQVTGERSRPEHRH